MGNAVYETPLREAGYAVEDQCHQDGCSETIDRGLGYLCGSQPGRADEYGCGRWFCLEHLFMPPPELPASIGGGLCESCMDRLPAPEVGAGERD